MLPVPVVSLGAGNRGDGVHIITSDLFKFYDRHTPRHSKVYMEIFPVIQKVLQDYHDDVVNRRYPGPEHTVFMKEEELKRFRDLVNWKR
jgi:3-methyl-2-oxobutanoate hydroxymethyltransferase